MVLLYTTGNYSQYLIVTYMKKNMCVCVCYLLIHVQLFEAPVDGSPPGSSVHEIHQVSRQEYWSG